MSRAADIRLEPSWKALLADEFQQPYMQQLRAFLVAEKAAGQTLYPAGSRWFAALDNTPFDQVKVVILGQDPYSGAGQAHGLCFSVRPDTVFPPSLKNIFKEIENDLLVGESVFRPPSGDLTSWARQGVLLLNSALTVVQNKPASHQDQGWQQFTDRIITLLATKQRHLVFMLWGSYAQRKGAQIDRSQHLVLTAPHPSPLSAYRGFLGCQHFSQCNQYLEAHQRTPIDWLQAGQRIP